MNGDWAARWVEGVGTDVARGKSRVHSMHGGAV